MEVGVRELKQRLSAYLDRAEQGEVIRVTDRGRPKALIIAVPGADPIERGVQQGWIRAPLHGGGLSPTTAVPGRRRVLDLLAEDRSDD